MTANNSLPRPTVEQSNLVCDEFVKIRKDLLRLPEGQGYTYYTLVTKSPAVIVLAITQDKLLVVNEEYRHPTGKALLCFPGGYMDEGEGPLTAAQRELLEETGYTAKQFVLMGSAFPYPGISDQRLYYVLAQEAYKKANPSPDVGEVLRTSLKCREDVLAEVASGRDVDGTLCTALFFYDLSR